MNLRSTFGNYPTDEQIDEMLKVQFNKITGLHAEEVSHAFPFDRWFTVHTLHRTFQGQLTWGARKIEKNILYEDTVDGTILFN